MKPLAIICIDPMTAQYPEDLGLDGEELQAQGWLQVICDAARARVLVPAIGAKHVWVAGSDTVDAINLAAALVRDGCAQVSLVAMQTSGSLYSRARAAGIARILNCEEFLKEYMQVKAASLQAAPPVQPVQPLQAVQPVRAAQPFQPFQPLQSAQAFAKQHPAEKLAASPHCMQTPTDRCVLGVGHHKPRHKTAVGKMPVFQEPVRPVYELREEPPVEEAPAALFPPSAHVSGWGSLSAKGAVLVVVGAAGGVGKSTIATASATASAQSGKRTVIVDADLQCGDIHYLTGQDKAMRIDTLLAAPNRIESLSSPEGVPTVIASPRALEQSEVISSALPSLIDALRQRFDCVIVNTGPAWDDLHMELLALATSVLFVLDQRPTGIRLCRHVLDLCARCGIATQSFVFVLNRCSRGSLFSSIDVSCALSGAKAVEIIDGGHIVEELLGCGQPADLAQSRNGLWTSIQKSILPLLGVSNAMPQALPRTKRKWRTVLSRSQETAACL